MSEWQPIETAPKDGATFIIGRDDSEHHAYSGVAYWSLGRFRDPTESVTKTVWVDPTHWMPLPAPPVHANQGAGR
jgi:hypothetical protein